MKTPITRSLAIACLASVLFAAPARAEELDLAAFLRAQLAQLAPLLNEAEPQPPARAERSQRIVPGLHSTGLTTGSLQFSAGIESAAGGRITPEEWRLLFPRKSP